LNLFDISVMVALTTILGFLGHSIYNVLQALVKAQQEAQDTQDLIHDASARSARLGDKRTAILAQIASSQDLVTKTQAENNKMLDRCHGIIIRSKDPYFILSDKITLEDREWIVPVTNPHLPRMRADSWMARSWASGRHYVVWATRPESAHRAVIGQFPPAGGFEVGTAVLSLLHLGQIWKVHRS
jgi:hypothetical protein